MIKVRKSLLWGIALLMMLLAACGQKDVVQDIGEGDLQEDVGEIKEVMLPFTGEYTTESNNNRAYAVMVNNHTQARPQTGLSKADIVFEMLTEGNVTRFLAIYQSTQPDVVGPVRSAREYYFTLANGYDAVYVYHGAADFINDMILSRNIDHIAGSQHDNDGYLFVREPFRKAPHNSYFQATNIYDAMAEKGYETQFTYDPFSFTDESELEDSDGTYVKINYSPQQAVVTFEYDESSGKYHRYDNGELTVELTSEIPIEIDNVFIVEAEHRVIDEDSRRFIDIESGGDAYLLQQGRVEKVEWVNDHGRIIPVKDGETIPFVPGKTWINFIPDAPSSGETEQVQFSNE